MLQLGSMYVPSINPKGLTPIEKLLHVVLFGSFLVGELFLFGSAVQVVSVINRLLELPQNMIPHCYECIHHCIMTALSVSLPWRVW